MHLAETREQARRDVAFGLQDWLRYFREVAALPLAPAGGVDDAIEALNHSGLAVIGTPEDATAQIERLTAQSGGFGCFLFMAHDWADFERTRRSYELFARYVMPRFQHANVNREASLKWAAGNRSVLIGAVAQAIGNEIQKHGREQAEKQERGSRS
jgi:limonene 1,2-monooxygenase